MCVENDDMAFAELFLQEWLWLLAFSVTLN